MSVKHVRITIKGKVHGVFFRASTREKADTLGIHGFVRNDPDGTVYIEAEAEQDKLDQLIAWCKTGPPRATVTVVQVSMGELKNFTSFELRR